MNLDEDPQDGVDMMLEYLYTLQKPIHPTRAKAETVYTIADKYDLQQLRLQALDVLMSHTGMICSSWERKSEEEKADTIDWIRKVRSWEQQDSAQLREICLRRLSGMSASMLDHEPFKKLLLEDDGFCMDFIKAMKQEVRPGHRF